MKDSIIEELKEKWLAKYKKLQGDNLSELILNDLLKEACMRYAINTKEFYEFLLYGDEAYFNKFKKKDIRERIDEDGTKHLEEYTIFPCYDCLICPSK